MGPATTGRPSFEGRLIVICGRVPRKAWWAGRLACGSRHGRQPSTARQFATSSRPALIGRDEEMVELAGAFDQDTLAHADRGGWRWQDATGRSPVAETHLRVLCKTTTWLVEVSAPLADGRAGSPDCGKGRRRSNPAQRPPKQIQSSRWSIYFRPTPDTADPRQLRACAWQPAPNVV